MTRTIDRTTFPCPICWLAVATAALLLGGISLPCRAQAAKPPTAGPVTTQPAARDATVAVAREAAPASQPAATIGAAEASTQPAGPAATRPARPTTGPTTRAADADVPDLIRGLSDGDWRKRDKFGAELARVGEPARPALEDLVRTTADADVRTAAQNVLREIDDNRVVGPSFITLHLNDVPQQQAFAELSKQAFATLKPYPDNLFEGSGGATVSIDVDRQPFWLVMRELTAKTGIELRDVGGTPGAKLMRTGGAGANADSRYVVAGAFQVVVNQLSLSRTVFPGAKGGRTDENFSIQLTAFAEPKLTVLRAGNSVKLEEVIDDKGNSLIPGAEDVSRRTVGYYGSGGSAGAWNLYAPLKYPKDPGKRIARFRGSAVFTIQTRSEKIEIANLMAVNESVHVVGGTRVVIKECKKSDSGGNQYQLRLLVGRSAAGDFQSIQSNIQNRLKVLDANDRALDSRGWSTSSRNGTELEMTINYAPSGARGSGEPAKLAWEIPVETRDLTIPFEFKDLEMP